jgi:class 3 adenylate cyclase/tetratricopeptide (TPR) repeat protein
MTLGDQTNTKTFDAVVGFVDLAGFTAAAEAFSHSGARGTERLVELINSLFTPAIAAIEAVGGEIGWFAGDAMGVLFDRTTTTDAQAVAALAQASRLIAALPPVEVDGREVRLGAKVGVAAGPVSWTSIDGDHVTTWFGGAAIDLAVGAEHHAVPGDLIVHESVQVDVGQTVAANFARFHATDLPDPIGTADGSWFRERRNPQYQPAKIARLATLGDVRTVAEHRPVTVFFASMPASTHDSNELVEIRAAVEQQGGMLSGVTEGDKGAVVMAVFGAPTSHPERADRALQAATQIRELNPGVRIGVTSGRVFAGPVGSNARWDYTTIGDRVNVAARLMQAAAPGEILVDVDTIRESRRRVNVGPQRTLDLKGKSTDEIAIPLVSLAARDQTVLLGSSRTSFVGRDGDVTALVAALNGDQSLIVIRGDAGSGKSRLVDHLIGLKSSGQFAVTWLEQADVGRPFQLWRRLFQRLVGVDRAVFDALSEERRNDPRLPVASAILGVELPDTTLVANLASAARFEVMVSVVDDLLSELIDGHDVVIEDLHWADDQSLELLRRLAPRLYGRGIHILAAARPEERADLLADVGLVHPLGDLVPGALGELATDRWTSAFGQAPHVNLVETLVERGAGSPLFVEQLVELAHDFGVDPSIEEWPTELVFPTNLTDVVLSRLDRLPDRAGLVAKLASVLGRTFTTDDVVGSFGHSYDASLLIAGLDLLVDAGFVVFGTPNHFHHALFAESAYERMPFGQRAEFHRDVLLHLERVHPDPKLVANDLARHAEHTDDTDRKRKYFLVAGDEAMRAYVSKLAQRWYNLLLELLPHAERGSVYFKLGRMHMYSGEYVSAARELAQALPSLSGDDLVAAQTDRAEALIRSGSTAEGFAILDDLGRQLEQSEDWANLRLVLNNIGFRSTMMGDTKRLEDLESWWLRLVEKRQDFEEFLEPLEGLTQLHQIRGDIPRALAEINGRRDLAVQQGDLFRAAHYACDSAGMSFLNRDLKAALLELDYAAQLMDTVGNRTDRMGFVSLNEVLLREEVGDSDGALFLASSLLDEALAIGEGRATAYLCRSIGSTSGVEHWLLRALLLAHSLDHQGVLIDAVRAVARMALQNGRPTAAIQYLEIVAAHRPLDISEKLDVLRARQRESECGLRAILKEIDSLSCSTVEVDDLAQIRTLKAELTGDAADLAVAIRDCRQSFSVFPSENINRCHLVLTGERLPLPENFPVVAFGDISRLGVGAHRIDTLLGFADNKRGLEMRCAEILANLGTVGSSG